MRYLLAIIDALAGFVQRNPLTMLVILVLALGAPALLKGIALVILYLIMGLLVLILVGMLLLRWHMNKVRRQMEEQFGADGRSQRGFWQEPRDGGGRRSDREGEVHVYRTPETPEKRVSKDVGDYIDFEEEKN